MFQQTFLKTNVAMWVHQFAQKNAPLPSQVHTSTTQPQNTPSPLEYNNNLNMQRRCPSLFLNKHKHEHCTKKSHTTFFVKNHNPKEKPFQSSNLNKRNLLLNVCYLLLCFLQHLNSFSQHQWATPSCTGCWLFLIMVEIYMSLLITLHHKTRIGNLLWVFWHWRNSDSHDQGT